MLSLNFVRSTVFGRRFYLSFPTAHKSAPIITAASAVFPARSCTPSEPIGIRPAHPITAGHAGFHSSTMQPSRSPAWTITLLNFQKFLFATIQLEEHS